MVQRLDQAVQGMQSAERISRVQVSQGVLCNCITHALTTEKEEIMGLLLGDTVQTETGETITNIWRAVPQVRNDRRKDRVECSGAQMAEVAQQAERITEETGRTTRVVGWYHSHPHITVLPSHIDVNTQASYQALDSGFVGLIVSCFNRCHGAEEGDRVSVIAFQSVLDGSAVQEVDVPEADDEEDAQMRQALAASRAQMVENRSTAWAKRIIPISITSPAPGMPDRGHLEDLHHLQSALVEEEWAPYEAEAAALRTEAHMPAQLLRTVHSSSVVCQSLSDLIQGSLLPSLTALHSRSFLLEQKRMEALKRLERAIQKSEGMANVPSSEARKMLHEFSKPLQMQQGPEPAVVTGRQHLQSGSQHAQHAQQQVPQHAQQLPATILSQPNTPTASQNIPQNAPQSLPLDADVMRQQHARSEHAVHAQSHPQMQFHQQVPTSAAAITSAAQTLPQMHAVQQLAGSSSMHALHAHQQALLPNSGWGQSRDMQHSQHARLQANQMVGGDGAMHVLPPPPPPPQQQQHAWRQQSHMHGQHAQHGMVPHSMAMHAQQQQQWVEAQMRLHNQQQQQDVTQVAVSIDQHFNNTQHSVVAHPGQWEGVGVSQAPPATPPGAWQAHSQTMLGTQPTVPGAQGFTAHATFPSHRGNSPHKSSHTGSAATAADTPHGPPSAWGPQKHLSTHAQHAHGTSDSSARTNDGSKRSFSNQGLPKGAIDSFLSGSPSNSLDASPATHNTSGQHVQHGVRQGAPAAARIQPQASTENSSSTAHPARSSGGALGVSTGINAPVDTKLSTQAQVSLNEAFTAADGRALPADLGTTRAASGALSITKARAAAAHALEGVRDLGVIGDRLPAGKNASANVSSRASLADGRSTSEVSSSMHAGHASGLGGFSHASACGAESQAQSVPSSRDTQHQPASASDSTAAVVPGSRAGTGAHHENGAFARAHAQAQKSMHALSQTAAGDNNTEFHTAQNGQQVVAQPSAPTPPAPPTRKSYAHATSYAAAASNPNPHATLQGATTAAAAALAGGGGYAEAASAAQSSEAVPGAAEENAQEGVNTARRSGGGRGGKGRGGGGGNGSGYRTRGSASNTAGGGSGGGGGGAAGSNAASGGGDMQRTSRGRNDGGRSRAVGGSHAQPGKGAQAVQGSCASAESSKASVHQGGEFSEPKKKGQARGGRRQKTNREKGGS